MFQMQMVNRVQHKELGDCNSKNTLTTKSGEQNTI